MTARHVLDIPAFLLRRPPSRATDGARSPHSDAITLRHGETRKRRKAPATCAVLRALGYTDYAIARMPRDQGEWIAHKRKPKEG